MTTRIAETLFPERAPAPNVVDVGPASGDQTGPRMRRAHPDKAISQRATLLAALAAGMSTVAGLADCADVRANVAALEALGTPMTVEGDRLHITGRDASRWRSVTGELDVGNSATTARLLMAILAAGRGSHTITGNPLLRTRPMGQTVQLLTTMGARVAFVEQGGRLPVRVEGRALRPAELAVRTDSAQPVSALLFAATAAGVPVTVYRRTVARDHTERLLRWTGADLTEEPVAVRLCPVRPAAFSLDVPGDPSGAALIVALHLASNAASTPLTVRDVGLNPRRTGFFDLLARMGVEVRRSPALSVGPEPLGDLEVRRPGPWRGIDVSGPALVQSSVDELPIIAALASVGDRPTRIADAAELRDKDTDRIGSTVELLAAFGVPAEPTADGLVVRPHPPRAPREVDLPADHRIVFAAFVLSVLAGGGVRLRGTAAAATSHPGVLDTVRDVASVREAP